MVAIRELFLRKNNISDIQELQYLSGLQYLHVLWLAENPVTATPNCEQPTPSCDSDAAVHVLPNTSRRNFALCFCSFLMRYRRTDRQTVLKFMPSLLKLDSIDVTPEERAQAANSMAPAPAVSKPALVPMEAAAVAPQRQSPEQSNVVAAVMLLLRELDEPALMRLREHIDQRLTN
jgi:hypothetical protein